MLRGGVSVSIGVMGGGHRSERRYRAPAEDPAFGAVGVADAVCRPLQVPGERQVQRFLAAVGLFAPAAPFQTPSQLGPVADECAGQLNGDGAA